MSRLRKKNHGFAVCLIATILACCAPAIHAQQAKPGKADICLKALLAGIGKNLPPGFSCAMHVSIYDELARAKLPAGTRLPHFQLAWKAPNAIDVTVDFPDVPNAKPENLSDLRERFDFAARQFLLLRLLRLQRFSLLDRVSLRMNRIHNKKLLARETIAGTPCDVLDLSGFFAPIPPFSAVTHARIWIDRKEDLPLRIVAWTQTSGVFVTDIRFRKQSADKTHTYLLPDQIDLSPRATLNGPVYTNPLVIRFDDYHVQPPSPKTQANRPSFFDTIKIDFK